MITNAAGKYEFRTIKPASYPNSRVASHVHYIVSGDGFRELHPELRFRDDSFLSEERIREEEKKGKFSAIRALVKDADGILRCEFNIKLEKVEH